MTDKEHILIDMMFDSRPIEEFEQLWESKENFDWSRLLQLCYCEESYESVGGDEGYLDNPPNQLRALRLSQKAYCLS